MAPATRIRQLPSGPRSVGFELETPGAVEVDEGDSAVKMREQRDGKPVGELEVSVFQAALVIDRDGILEEKVHEAARAAAGDGARVTPAVPIELPGASGFRADVEIVLPLGAGRPPLPYVHVFAIAPHDLGVDGGVLVTVRSATPDWPAADAILKSLWVLGRRGKIANLALGALPSLPIVGKDG
jgi:hypothetical protein